MLKTYTFLIIYFFFNLIKTVKLFFFYYNTKICFTKIEIGYFKFDLWTILKQSSGMLLSILYVVCSYYVSALLMLFWTKFIHFLVYKSDL